MSTVSRVASPTADLLDLRDHLPVDVPEPVGNAIAELLPQAAHGWLSALPLPLYQFDPAWRNACYNTAVAVETLVLTTGSNPFEHVNLEAQLHRQQRRGPASGRQQEVSAPGHPPLAVDDGDARDQRPLADSGQPAD